MTFDDESRHFLNFLDVSNESIVSIFQISVRFLIFSTPLLSKSDHCALLRLCNKDNRLSKNSLFFFLLCDTASQLGMHIYLFGGLSERQFFFALQLCNHNKYLFNKILPTYAYFIIRHLWAKSWSQIWKYITKTKF